MCGENRRKNPFGQDYTIITQHWGVMVGLMGVLMIVAAFKVEWSFLCSTSWSSPSMRRPIPVKSVLLFT